MSKIIIAILLAFILLGGCTRKTTNTSYIKDDNICAICEKKIEWTVKENVFKVIAEYTCDNGFVHPECKKGDK